MSDNIVMQSRPILVYHKLLCLKVCLLFTSFVLCYNVFFMIDFPNNPKTGPALPILIEKLEKFSIQISIDDCFKYIPENIDEFYSLWKQIKKIRPKNCIDFITKFMQIYDFEERFSKQMLIPFYLQTKLKLTLNENDFRLISKQKIISVFNVLTFEQTLFNPLRSRRPQVKEKESIWHYVEAIDVESIKKCDFCDYIHKTASDQFGRSETLFTVRMSNLYKLDKWHGMVLTKNHHPINISAEVLETMLEDAYKWTREIQQIDPAFVYPNLGMDTLNKAGASQMHPHLHVIMTPYHHYGGMDQLRSVALQHFRDTGRNYFNDLVQLYSTLGLAVRYKSAIALSMMTGKGDMEVMIMSLWPNRDLYRLLYYVIDAYRVVFQQVCYSTSMAWPPVVSTEGKFDIPAIIRIVSRGNCQSKLNDISNFDLFLVNYRSHDPWDVAKAIQGSVTNDTAA